MATLCVLLLIAWIISASGKRGVWWKRVGKVRLSDLINTLFSMSLVAKRTITGEPGTPLPYLRDNEPAPHGIGRNETCPCGSGDKYKNCCGFKRPR